MRGPVVRKNSIGSHVTEMLALICSASLRKEAPKTNLANRRCFSAGPNLCNSDRPCFDSFGAQSAHWILCLT
jgi:hypothetical protein